MVKKNKETVGKIALDLMSQKQENNDPIAQQEAMLSDFDKNFNQAFERGQAQFGGTFFVVVITKKERLLENILRNYFLVRESCPTPEFDQTVYKCSPKGHRIDLLWTVPNNQACEMFKARSHAVPKEQEALLKCVLRFHSGDLLAECKRLNGELKESTALGSFNPEDFDDHENLIVMK